MRKFLSVLMVSAVAIGASTPAGLCESPNGISVSVDENEKRLQLHYNLPEVSLQEKADFTTLQLGNAPLFTSAGKPKVPHIPLRFVIPDGMEIHSIDIEFKGIDTVSYRLPIEPGSPVASLTTLQSVQSFSLAYDDDVLREGDQWPVEPYRECGIQYKVGHSIGIVQLFPVQLNIENRELYAAKGITCTIHWKKSRSIGSSLEKRPLDRRANQLENSVPPVSRKRGSAAYLVIAVDSLIGTGAENLLQPLLDHHAKSGLASKILTLQTIDANYEGLDLQEKIRNAITEHYNTAGTEFVLLVGDAPQLPVRRVYMDEAVEGYKKGLPSDMYYACLDGNFNSDNDEYWGESTDGGNGAYPDQLAEVSVGRFPVQTREELGRMVTKTLTHLQAKKREKILFAGEHLGFGGISEFAKPSMEEMWAGGEANGMVTRSFAQEPGLERDTLYAEKFTNHKWYDKDIISLINSDEFGIINHLGHGLERLNMRIYLDTDGLRSIANSRPLFVNSQACLSGNFTKRSIAEAFTAGTEYGMWGGVWNSDNGLGAYRSTDSPSQFLQRYFWDGYFGRELTTVGEMTAYADEAAIDMSMIDWSYRWVSLITNLIGDPAAQLFLRGEEKTIDLDPIGEGNIWEQGHSFSLSWFDNFDEPLTIELTKDGQVLSLIEERAPSVQKYEWTIGSDIPLGEGYRLRFSNSDLQVSDSTELFNVEKMSTLKLLSPKAGETYLKGDTLTIEWEDDINEAVTLELYMGDKKYATIAESVAPSAQQFAWKIPTTIQHEDAYEVRVVSSRKPWLYGGMDSVFSINSPTITEFPYVQTFDTYELGSDLQFWNQLGGDEFDWKVHTGATPSRITADDWWNVTGPTGDVSGDGNYLYCEATGNEGGKRAALLSPPINIEGLKDGKLTYRVHMYNKSDYGNMGELSLYLLVDGNWVWGPTIKGAQGDRWIEKSVDLSKHADAKELFLYFQAKTGNNFASDIALDEVRITGEKDPVSVLDGSWKKSEGLQFSPSIITDENRLIITTDDKKSTRARVQLFDKVGNTIIAKELQGSKGLWSLPLPQTLQSGSYLFQITTEGLTGKQYRAVLGCRK